VSRERGVQCRVASGDPSHDAPQLISLPPRARAVASRQGALTEQRAEGAVLRRCGVRGRRRRRERGGSLGREPRGHRRRGVEAFRAAPGEPRASARAAGESGGQRVGTLGAISHQCRRGRGRGRDDGWGPAASTDCRQIASSSSVGTTCLSAHVLSLKSRVSSRDVFRTAHRRIPHTKVSRPRARPCGSRRRAGRGCDHHAGVRVRGGDHATAARNVFVLGRVDRDAKRVQPLPPARPARRWVDKAATHRSAARGCVQLVRGGGTRRVQLVREEGRGVSS